MKTIKLQYVNDNMTQLAEELANLIVAINNLHLPTSIELIHVASFSDVRIAFDEELDETDIDDIQNEIDATGFTWRQMVLDPPFGYPS